MTDPKEQRGGTTPDDAEAGAKGDWAGTAREGVAPREDGGADPELGSEALGRTTGSDEPATAEGIDRTAGDHADATTDGGAEPPAGPEPDLKDAAASVRERRES